MTFIVQLVLSKYSASAELQTTPEKLHAMLLALEVHARHVLCDCTKRLV